MRVCLSSLLCLAVASAVAAEKPFLSSKLRATGPSDKCEVGHFGCNKFGDTCFLGEAGEILGKCVSGGMNNFGQQICNCVESFEARLKAKTNVCDEGHHGCTKEGDSCLTGDGRTKGRCHVSHQTKLGKNVCACVESYELSASHGDESPSAKPVTVDPFFDYLLICQDGAASCDALQAGDVCRGEDGASKGTCMVSGRNAAGQHVCKCIVEEKPKPAPVKQTKCDGYQGCWFVGSSCFRDNRVGFCVSTGSLNRNGVNECHCRPTWQPTWKPNNKAAEIEETAKLGATNSVCDEGHLGCTKAGDRCLTGDGRTQGVCQVSHQNKLGKNVCACVESS